jgi:polysaccharide pyruvyl transferase WcaK-like protein
LEKGIVGVKLSMCEKEERILVKGILVSFFNSNNIGDVLISEALFNNVVSCGYIVERCSYEGSFIITGNIENSINETGIKKTVNTLLPSKIVRRIHHKLKTRKFWTEFEKKIKKSDVLIIGGGNMIMGLTPQSKPISLFEKYINLAKKYQKKIIVLSIGIGPFHTFNQIDDTKRVLKKCDYVTFRDEESFSIGSTDNKNHFVSVDPVYMMPALKKHPLKAKRLTIGIGVINTLLFNSSKEFYTQVRDSYVSLINKLLINDYDIVIFSTEKADTKMIEDVNNFFNNKRVRKEYIQTSKELLDLYSKELSFLIAARMHSLIIAFTQFIPIIGLSWQAKVKSMFKIIDSLDHCIQIDQLEDHIEEIVLLVHNKIGSNEYIEKTEAKLEELKIKYEINKNILETVKKDLNRSFGV